MTLTFGSALFLSYAAWGVHAPSPKPPKNAPPIGQKSVFRRCRFVLDVTPEAGRKLPNRATEALTGMRGRIPIILPRPLRVIRPVSGGKDEQHG